MASWGELAQQAPELTEGGAQLLYQYGPGLGYMATIRPDGGPRLHPMCPIICDGELWAYILRESPKGRDLHRDGRYAVHACGPDDVDDEFCVTGTVEFVEPDPALRQRIIDSTSASVGAVTEDLFRLDIERAMLARYTHRGQWPPAYTIWVEGRGLTTR
jgi:hypothetical protein